MHSAEWRWWCGALAPTSSEYPNDCTCSKQASHLGIHEKARCIAQKDLRPMHPLYGG
jgi:hypothetical protein